MHFYITNVYSRDCRWRWARFVLLSGETGRAGGAHLHFCCPEDTKRPCPFFKTIFQLSTRRGWPSLTRLYCTSEWSDFWFIWVRSGLQPVANHAHYSSGAPRQLGLAANFNYPTGGKVTLAGSRIIKGKVPSRSGEAGFFWVYSCALFICERSGAEMGALFYVPFIAYAFIGHKKTESKQHTRFVQWPWARNGINHWAQSVGIFLVHKSIFFSTKHGIGIKGTFKDQTY